MINREDGERYVLDLRIIAYNFPDQELCLAEIDRVNFFPPFNFILEKL